MASKYYSGEAMDRYSKRHRGVIAESYAGRIAEKEKDAQTRTSMEVGGSLYNLYSKGKENIAESKLSQTSQLRTQSVDATGNTISGYKDVSLYEEAPMDEGEGFVQRGLESFRPTEVQMKGSTIQESLMQPLGTTAAGDPINRADETFDLYSQGEWNKQYSRAYKDIKSGFDKGTAYGASGTQYKSFKDLAGSEDMQTLISEQVGSQLGIKDAKALQQLSTGKFSETAGSMIESGGKIPLHQKLGLEKAIGQGGLKEGLGKGYKTLKTGGSLVQGVVGAGQLASGIESGDVEQQILGGTKVLAAGMTATGIGAPIGEAISAGATLYEMGDKGGIW